MERADRLRAAALVCRVLLGLVFLVSAAAKAFNMDAFQGSMAAYRVITDRDTLLIGSWVVVLGEAALGVALLAGWYLRGLTLAGVSAMLVGFSALIGYAWLARGLEDCGCFGNFVKMSPPVSIAKNVVMLAALVPCALVWWRQTETRWSWGPTGLKPVLAAPLMLLAVGGTAGLAWSTSAVAEEVAAPPAVAQRDRAPKGEDAAPISATPTPAPAAGPTVASMPKSGYGPIRATSGEVIDLSAGEYLVAYLSMTCEHCKASVPGLIEITDTLGGQVALVGLALGDEREMAEFRTETGAEFPMAFLRSLDFFDRVPGEPPRIVLVRDGAEVADWEGAAPSLDEFLAAYGS